MEKISELNQIKEKRNVLGNWITIDDGAVHIYYDMCPRPLLIISTIYNPIAKVVECLNMFGFNIKYVPHPTYTKREKAFVVAFDDGWVSCDKSGDCWFHITLPTRHIDYWHDNEGTCFQVPQPLFAWMTWEDEPLNLKEVK